jgi:hypothetical protein
LTAQQEARRKRKKQNEHRALSNDELLDEDSRAPLYGHHMPGHHFNI